MADQVSSKVAELSWAIGKFVLKASGSGLLADAGETAGKAYKLVRSLIENSGSDVNNDVAEQINKVLTSKIRSMYGRPAVNKELLEVAATEVKLLLDQITDDDKLLVVAVKNPDSFSDLLRKLAYARQLDIEQEAEPYFRELVDVVKEQYVKVAPRSSEFDKAALKDLFASNEQALTKINQVYELLEDTNKEVKNSNAKLDDFKEDMDALLKRGDAEVASKVSVQKPLIFGRRPYVVESYYIEREEQVRLRNLINEDPRLRVVLVGMRGCGKSQLASDLAQWCEKQKWHLVAWINATSKEQVQSGLIELADRLGIETQDRNEESIIEQCFSHLESGEPSDRLIVFDNVEDINHLTKLVPRGDGLRVVVTTTNEHGWKNQSWDSIKVGVFSREDSIKCLLQITDSEDREAADAVAQKLGDLPLAIVQAGATACEEDLTLKQYISRLEHYSSSIVIKRVLGDDYTADVSSTLFMAVNVALDKLGGDEREVARRQLGGLAVLAQSGVPTRWIDPLSPDAYSSDLEENVPDIADKNAHSALTELVNMSVVQQSVNKNVTMLHRLQAHVLRENWGKEKTATCEEAFDAAVEILGRTKYEQLPSNNGDARRREVRDLIVQLSAIAAQKYSHDLFRDETVRDYLRLALRWATNIGIPFEALILEDAVNQIEKIPDSKSRDTFIIQANLAVAYRVAGKLKEAVKRLEQIDEKQTSSFGCEDHDVLAIRSELAFSYRVSGQLDKSISLFEEILEARKNTPDDSRCNRLITCGNLAGAYVLAGRLSDAIKLYREEIEDIKDALGEKNKHTLTSRNNLAVAYALNGKLNRSIDIFKQVRDARRKTLGEEDPHTISSRNNVAYAHALKGEFEQAISEYEKVSDFSACILGENHPTTLTIRNNLASAYSATGKFEDAISMHEKVYDSRKSVMGVEHPHTLISKNNLAYVYTLMKKFDIAIPIFEEILDAREKILSINHPDTLTSRNNLACAYKSYGQVDKAIPIFEEVLAIREDVLSVNHPDTLTSRNNLAAAYVQANRLNEAVDALVKLLPDCQRALDSEHPLTKLVEKNLEVAKRKMNPPDALSPEMGED